MESGGSKQISNPLGLAAMKMSTPVDVPLVGNEHKIEGYNFGKEVKAVAVSPMHDAIIVGGRDGIAIFYQYLFSFQNAKDRSGLKH